MRRQPTPSEAIVWAALRKDALGLRFHRQKPCFGYILDFYCPAIGVAIEVDGAYHTPEGDMRRDAHLASRGIRTIRIKNSDATSIPRVRDIIRARLDECP